MMTSGHAGEEGRVELGSRWWIVLLVAAVVSVVGATAALVRAAPTQDRPGLAPGPAAAPGQVTPLAVATFGGKAKPVDGTDDRTHLAYELSLTNISTANLTLERVRVLDPSRGGRVVDVLSGDELDSRTIVFGGPPNKQFGPGVSGFLFMDVTYPVGPRLPDKLNYRFDVSTSSPTGLANRFRAGPTRVGEGDPVRIGSPLRGERWMVGEGCCDTITSHRGAIFPINGTFYAPERFAIDWVQVGENGRLYDGPEDKLSSYPYYGARVLAVSNGLVVGTRNNQPEQTPGQFPDDLALKDFGGNYVVIKSGDGRYAYYAHLQEGSDGVRVQPGEWVRKGQVIGKLGNTGNTDAPHLHFMMIDGKTPLTSRALPFEIGSFHTRGVVANYGAFLGGSKAQMSSGQRGEKRNRLPLHATVNDFR